LEAARQQPARVHLAHQMAGKALHLTAQSIELSRRVIVLIRLQHQHLQLVEQLAQALLEPADAAHTVNVAGVDGGAVAGFIGTREGAPACGGGFRCNQATAWDMPCDTGRANEKCLRNALLADLRERRQRARELILQEGGQLVQLALKLWLQLWLISVCGQRTAAAAARDDIRTKTQMRSADGGAHLDTGG
jgi:hypothetical protein